jgi:hypothetical protein
MFHKTNNRFSTRNAAGERMASLWQVFARMHMALTLLMMRVHADLSNAGRAC